MGNRHAGLSLAALLALTLPVAAPLLLAAPPAHAQQAVFADTLVELVSPGEVIGDGVTAVTLNFVLLDATGAPVQGATLKATAASGKVGGVVAVSPGVYKVSWTPSKVDASKGVDIFLKGKTLDKKAIDKRWSVSVRPSLAQQVTATSNPNQIVLGQDGSATLNFTLSGGPTQPLAGAELDVRTTAGTIANITHLGGGQFTALYTPPAQPYPQLAVITMADRRDPARTYGALAVPLVGKASFPVQSKPNARVILKVGEREFGPIQADASGRASVPIVVTPGLDTGTLVSIVGEQRTEEPLPLKIPASPRLLMLPTPKAVPADPSVSVPVRVYVATATGSADSAAQVTFTASAGTMSPSRHEGNGIYVASWTPPSANPPASVTITANLADPRGAQSNALSLNLVGQRPATVQLTAEPQTLAADGTSLRVLAKVKGPEGQALTKRNVVLIADGAQLQGPIKELGNGDYQGLFTTTGTGPVDVMATVTAPASGNPLRQVLAFPSRERVPNDGVSGAMVTVLTLDEYGYPVAGQAVKVAVATGDGKVPAQVTTNEAGIGQIYYTAGRAAGMVSLQLTAGDHLGATTLLQAPAGVAEGIALPRSGSDTTLKLSDAWRSIVTSTRVERQGAASLPVAAAVGTAVASAPTSAWGGPATPGRAARVVITSNPPNATPGSLLELEILVQDGSGLGVDGQTLDFLTSAGTLSPVQSLGQGRYRTSIIVPNNGMQELKISAATADGAASGFIRVPFAAGAAPVWGAPDQAWGGAPATAAPATAPATAAPPATAPSNNPSSSLAAAMTTGTTSGSTTTTRTRTPPSDDDHPWLRMQAGYAGGLYSYSQSPSETGSPLYQSTISFGSLATAAGSTAAPTAGLNVQGRAWIPGMRWLGVDVGLRSTYYSVQIPAASALIPDWVTQIHGTVVPRYRFDAGSAQLHVGGRVGFSASDFMVYQQPPGTNTLEYGPIFVPSLDLGAEFGAEVGSIFTAVHGQVGLANGSDPYATHLGLDLGWAFSEHLFAQGAFGLQSREISVWLDPTNETKAKQEVGTLADKAVEFSLGVGYQL